MSLRQDGEEQLGTPLGEAVATRIRAAIIERELLPGERLTENSVAEWLGVSSIPVREALQQLAQEGLVIKKPRRGTYVRGFDARDIRHLFQVRFALDAQALRILAAEGLLTGKLLHQLSELIDKQKVAIAERDFELATDVELQFHGSIYACIDSELFSSIWEMLRVRLRVLMHWHLKEAPDQPETFALASHLRILECLSQRDIESLISHLQARYAKTAEDLVAMLANTSES